MFACRNFDCFLDFWGRLPAEIAANEPWNIRYNIYLSLTHWRVLGWRCRIVLLNNEIWKIKPLLTKWGGGEQCTEITQRQISGDCKKIITNNFDLDKLFYFGTSAAQSNLNSNYYYLIYMYIVFYQAVPLFRAWLNKCNSRFHSFSVFPFSFPPQCAIEFLLFHLVAVAIKLAFKSWPKRKQN